MVDAGPEPTYEEKIENPLGEWVLWEVGNILPFDVLGIHVILS